jgi:diguanylate cyclase (GGDEF)-like protein/PAS domain S-box-containing protein
MRKDRRRFGWQIVGAITLTITLALHLSGALTRADWAAQDLYSRWLRHEVRSDIVIVGIDERSLAALRQWPWRRSIHAQLLTQLIALHPRHIFFDVDFSSVSSATDDQTLARAFRQVDPSVLILPAFRQVVSSDPADVLLTRPLAEFQPNATLGSVNLVPATDSLVRDINADWSAPGMHLPAVFALLSARAPSAGPMAIDYSLSPASFQFVSYVDVLQGRVDPAVLRGKTIMIGATAIELGDMQPVPVYRSLPGVVVQALAAQTARSGPLRTAGPWTACWLLAMWSALVAALMRAGGWRRNAAVAIGLQAVALGLTLAARSLHLELDVVSMLTAVAVSFLIVALRSLDAEVLKSLSLSSIAERREALLRSVVESSTECILCVDDRGCIVSANSAAGLLFGGSEESLRRRSIAVLLPELVSPDQTGRMESLSKRICESTARTLDGNHVPIELSITPVSIKDQPLYTVLMRDLRDRKSQEERLRYQATHDALTGLPNRHALGQALEQRLQAVTPQSTIALCLLDLTRFKEVNDTLGHTFGDFVLREVASRFRAVLGERGILARMGGDEFVILAERDTSRDALAELALRLGESLKKPVRSEGLAIEVGVNIGIACYPEDARSPEELLKNADIAMYSAKRRGAAYTFYDSADNAHSVRSLAMLGDLRHALKHREFELHYQPKVHLQNGQVDSVEALLRWEHSIYGPVSPLEIIPLAESTDLLRPLTDWTIATAVAQVRDWVRAGQPTRIAVNISANMLQDLSLPERLSQQLFVEGVEPHMHARDRDNRERNDERRTPCAHDREGDTRSGRARIGG